MDSEKHVHISSPKGPEDASNIADEYPSPERTHATLNEHIPADEPSVHQQEQESSAQDAENQQQQQQEQEQQGNDHHEDTDMQTELVNQVAAQALEAAVAAEARANSSTRTQDQNQSQDVDMNIQNQHQQSQINGIGEDQIRQPQQHHPRQPTFPKSRLSSVSTSSPQYTHGLPISRSSKQKSITPKLTPNEQIAILREAYAKNPNPGKKQLEYLAEKTGRPWNKIREYFRQRRNKLRGLEDLENMQEPGRASGWLQVAYRQAPPTASITQLSLYNSYKHRFDPYSITTPLLGGQELIQLACATFPGCEMAKDENDYVLKGLKEKEKENNDNQNENGNEGENQGEQEEWEKGMEGLVEPLRAGSWLLSSFQHQNDPNAPSTLTQTDLYTSYAARFASLLISAGQSESTPSQEQSQQQPPPAQTQEEQDHEADMRAFEEAGLNDGANDQDQDQDQEQEQEVIVDGDGSHQHQSLASLLPLSDQPSSSLAPPPVQQQQQPKKENRLLNPFELINLTRMTFPKCEPVVDSSGKFVIKGLERRLGHIPGSREREREMFNFALYNESKPGEAFVGLMKRKLGMLNSDPSPTSTPRSTTRDEDGERESKKTKIDEAKQNEEMQDRNKNQNPNQDLSEEDKELIQGLKRFRNSQLGDQVRDVCISQ
ncbi:uncharacterized protein L199_007118 [Kwoniella botswanensis]|uniref:uncharacterized protein n=1 Tax=Kwoniella botswanensis TaxID=1268659 RepID=UPI00315DF89A